MPWVNDPDPQQHCRRRRYLPKFSGIAQTGLSSFSNTSIQQLPSLCDWFHVLAPFGLLNGSRSSVTQSHKRISQLPTTVPKMATSESKNLEYLADLTYPRSGQFQRKIHMPLNGTDAQQTPAQESLDQARRRFVSFLPSYHHFRKCVDTYGALLRENVNVKDTRRRRRTLLPDPLRTVTPKEMKECRMIYGKNLSKIDFDSAKSIMERNQLLSMWNQDWDSIDERRLAEERSWRTHNDNDKFHGAASSLREDFQRCIPKMQSLKRKFGLRELPKSVGDKNEDTPETFKRNKKEHKNGDVDSTGNDEHKSRTSEPTLNRKSARAEEKVISTINQVPSSISGRDEKVFAVIDEHHNHHHARQQVDKEFNSEVNHITYDSRCRCDGENGKRSGVKRNLFSPSTIMNMEGSSSSEQMIEDQESDFYADDERSVTCSDSHNEDDEDSIMTDAGYCEV